jgi:hypothetical protein
LTSGAAVPTGVPALPWSKSTTLQTRCLNTWQTEEMKNLESIKIICFGRNFQIKLNKVCIFGHWEFYNTFKANIVVIKMLVKIVLVVFVGILSICSKFKDKICPKSFSAETELLKTDSWRARLRRRRAEAHGRHLRRWAQTRERPGVDVIIS